MEFWTNTGESLVKKLQQIPDMTIDDWGYALGYGSEKVIEILLANKAAATMRAKVVVAAAKVEFDAVAAFKNAISPFNSEGLTNAGRGVTKHPKYFGFESTEALNKVYKTTEVIKGNL